MYRAFPLAIGIAAVQAAACLSGRRIGVKLVVNFLEFFDALPSNHFIRVLTPNVDKK